MDTAQIKKLREDFLNDGYVFLPGFLSKDEIQQINTRLEGFIRNAVPAMPANHVFYENKSNAATLKQLQDMQLYDPFFTAFLYKSRFEEVAGILLGESVTGKTIEYFNKPPAIGKPTPPHQDAHYFMIKPPQALTMWLALEDVDEETGCLRYIKGSHLRGMRPHTRTQTLGFSQGITDYGEQDFSNETALPANPGDLFIHHSMTIHRADANTSGTRSRKALGFIYYGESAQEDLEAKSVYKKILAETTASP